MSLNEFYLAFGFCLLGISLLFSLALFPRFERKFYPQPQSYFVRSIAPAVFLMMAATCFADFGFEMLVSVAVLGSVLVVRDRLLRKTSVAGLA